MNDTIKTTHLLVTLFALCLLAPPVSAQAHACSKAVWIEPGEIVRGIGRATGAPDCYRLATPGAGLLMVDVAVPASTAEPLITVAACHESQPVVLTAWPSYRLMQVAEASSLRVCVGAQDPLLRLDDFRLQAVFLPADAFTHKDEPIEVEPEGAKDEPIEVEPEGAKDEPIEVEPEGLTQGPGTLAAICGLARHDEHADIFPCATDLVLGRSVVGEIGDTWGDDRDIFAFQLSSIQTVRIWLAGEAELSAELLDSRGHRLALTSGFTSRRVKTLNPGTYYLSVQGFGGLFELEVRTVSRAW